MACPEFMDLVDEYIEACPVSSRCLAPENMRLAAARVLLLKNEQAKQPTPNWPKRAQQFGHTKLAAVLLVLFLQEHLC